jgi:hypothetical protein
MKNVKTNQILKAISIVGILALTCTQVKAQSTSDVAKAGTAVKVVDNKGTIKYFQSNNGITQITNTTSNKTTTTWQLGGTLTDDTYIDVDGKAFGLAGIALTTSSAATAFGGTGYSLMVRDETTGKVEALLASSLISGGVQEFTLVTADETANTFNSGPITGLSTVANRISVFRNGIKLVQSDWSLAAGAISITTPSTFTLYKDDVIEVQWVK